MKMNSLQKKAIEHARDLTEKARSEVSSLTYEKDEVKKKQTIQDAYDTIGQVQSWLGRVLESEAA